MTSPVPALLDRDQQREIARFVELGYGVDELLEMYYWLTREELCSFLAGLDYGEPDEW